MTRYRYIVKRICEIKSKKAMIMMDVDNSYTLEMYCAVAVALHLGIVSSREFSFNPIQNYQIIDLEWNTSWCIVREKFVE